MTWFRVYHDIIDDPKFMTLPLDVLGFWVVALSVASSRPERGTLPDVDELAFRTRQPLDKAREYVDLMLARRFLVRDKSGKLSVYKWAEYQPAWDDSKGRQRARRARLKSQGKDAEPADVSRDGHVTVTDQRRLEERREEVVVVENPPSIPSPTDAGAGAGGGGDDGGRAGLESWAKRTLGDRYDLENLGPNLTAWSLAYPTDWVRLAVESAVRARPGGLAAYAHRILARSHAAGRCVVADTLAPPPPAAGANGAGHVSVSKSQAAVDNWARYLEAKEQGKEAHDAPG